MAFTIIMAIIFNTMSKKDQFTAKFKIWQHLKILHEATTEGASLKSLFFFTLEDSISSNFT